MKHTKVISHHRFEITQYSPFIHMNELSTTIMGFMARKVICGYLMLVPG
mgnify:CR=1 FL=1